MEKYRISGFENWKVTEFRKFENHKIQILTILTSKKILKKISRNFVFIQKINLIFLITEYIGEVIRTELTDIREKRYEAQNRGIYMFRLDDERVLDASMCGGMARYINHCCDPNCVTEIVDVDRDLHIIIFANRRIARGEELSYDYKFDYEDENRIPCLCGAKNCVKWMN